MARTGHLRKGHWQEQWTIEMNLERVGRQVGPDGRGGCPPTVGQLKYEPRGILPPKVVRHSGEEAADNAATGLEDTDPRLAKLQ